MAKQNAPARDEQDRANRQSISANRIEPDRAEIELLAYAYWEQRGCPEDSPDDDWFRAEEDMWSGRVRPSGGCRV